MSTIIYKISSSGYLATCLESIAQEIYKQLGVEEFLGYKGQKFLCPYSVVTCACVVFNVLFQLDYVSSTIAELRKFFSCS